MELSVNLLTRKLLPYAVAALIVLLVCPLIGLQMIPPGQALRVFFGTAQDDTLRDILLAHRLPRVLLSFIVGGSLAYVGAALQVVLRNPLAAPSTLGSTQGGTIGAVLAITVPALSFRFGPLHAEQLLAMVGSCAALGLILALARRPEGTASHTLLLTGVTIGILANAVILFLSYLASPDLLVLMNHWMMGGVDAVGYDDFAALLPLLLPGLGLIALQAPALNHLALGEELALGHGVDVAAVQGRAFLGAGLCIAAIVSVTGPISFVGLIIPHIVRRLSGHDLRLTLPACWLVGGVFLTACDTLARTVIARREMPVGIITALAGGPFFIFLLLRSKRQVS